jgi:hypothetical protein
MICLDSPETKKNIHIYIAFGGAPLIQAPHAIAKRNVNTEFCFI